MKTLIVSIILLLAFHKEILSLLKTFFKSSVKKAQVIIDNEPSIVLHEEPQVQVQSESSELLSYDRMRLGADLIIRTTHGSGSKKVKLVSYVYDGKIARRVVVKANRERLSFEVVAISNVNKEAANFKEAYLASLSPVPVASKAPEAPKTAKAKPIPQTEGMTKKLLAEYKGRVSNFGYSPYPGSDSQSFAVDLITEEGTQTLYGTGLERALSDSAIEKGDVVTLLKYSPVSVYDGDSGARTSKAKIWVATKEA